MLESLSIEGYAIIDSLTLEFENGFTILSGETGAGKSILIGALSLVLGEKGDAGMVRAGHDETVVSSVIRVDHSPDALTWLSERDIRPEDGTVIVRRVLKPTGRGNIYVQSVPMTRADVQELTLLMFDIHGQHEHQSLLKTRTHRELIDRFGGIEKRVLEFRRIFSTLAERKQELTDLVEHERDRSREQDILEFAVREIDAAKLVPGEEDELEKEIGFLSQAEKLHDAMNDFHDRLSESRGGALAAMRQAMSEINLVSDALNQLKPFADRLENAFYEVEDVAASVRGYQDGIDFSPDRLETCDQRLAEIHRLEKKYGGSIEAVLSYRKEAAGKLERIENLDEERTRLSGEIEALEKRVRAEANGISKERNAAAKRLEAEIGGHLKHLGMAKASFEIKMNRRERDGRPVYTQFGIDAPEFLISSNQGEPARPLRDIASGGEMSRIMLAIKTVLADADEIRTLIFDEIDAGIGGTVAVAVGEHLASLSENKQVLCITHLPTIAVQADHHFSIRKNIRDDRTTTSVERLQGDARIAEIARMLSGDSGADVSRSHARELLAGAGKL